MRKNKLQLGIFILLFLFATNAIAQNNTRELKTFFSALFQNQNFNGNVLIAENGRVIYERSFGFADFASKRFNTKNTSFPIASITKTFTSTAILQLKEKGKLRLDDPVVKHYPEFPYALITIKHLLSHTSGLPPYDVFFEPLRVEKPNSVFTNADIIHILSTEKKPLLFQPGEKWNYDNINFIILALIVEKTSGMAFQEYLKKHIAEPARMTHTIFPNFTFYHYTDKELKNLAISYRYSHFYSNTLDRADSIDFVSKYWHSYNFKGFGEIISNTQDLLKYDQALYDGKLLDKATIEEAFTPVKLNDGSVNSNGYGLGWKIIENASLGKSVMHSGGMVGLRCILLRNTVKRQTVIIFDNTENEVDGIAYDVIKILSGQKVEYPKKSIAKVYGKVLVKDGVEAARKVLEQLSKDSSNYALNENEFNMLGYDLMGNNKLPEALEVFKTNTRLYPRSWNVYDSYGEALLKDGNKEEAIVMYRKSVELNPENENGQKVLAQLIKDDNQ